MPSNSTRWLTVARIPTGSHQEPSTLTVGSASGQASISRLARRRRRRGERPPGPAGSTSRIAQSAPGRAGREHLRAAHRPAAVDRASTLGPERALLARLRRLRLAAPGDPLLAALDDAVEPATALLVAPERVDEHERVRVPLPAARQREVGLGDLLGHHPEPEGVAVQRPEPEPAVLARHRRREQPGLEEVGEVGLGEARRAVVLVGAGGEPLPRQLADRASRTSAQSAQAVRDG